MSYFSKKMQAIFSGMGKPVSRPRKSEKRGSPKDLDAFSPQGSSLVGGGDQGDPSTSNNAEQTNLVKSTMALVWDEFHANERGRVDSTSVSLTPPSVTEPLLGRSKANRPSIVIAISDSPKPNAQDTDHNTLDPALSKIPGLPVVLTLTPATPVDETSTSVANNPYLPENYPYGYERDEEGDFEYRPYVDVTRLFGTWNMDEAMLSREDEVQFNGKHGGLEVNGRCGSGSESASSASESEGQTASSETETLLVEEVEVEKYSYSD